jgi:hypothetical protein
LLPTTNDLPAAAHELAVGIRLGETGRTAAGEQNEPTVSHASRTTSIEVSFGSSAQMLRAFK